MSEKNHEVIKPGVVRVSNPVTDNGVGDLLPKSGDTSRMSGLIDRYVLAQRNGDDLRSQFCEELPGHLARTEDEANIAELIYKERSHLARPEFSTKKLNNGRPIMPKSRRVKNSSRIRYYLDFGDEPTGIDTFE